VVFLLLKKFSAELETESEVFLMLLIRVVTEDSESGSDYMSPRPTWMRVLAMEVMRGLCSDADLVRHIWDRYDGEESGSNVFSALTSALNRLLTEKPALLGVAAQMSGIGVPQSDSVGSSGSGYGLDGMAGMVATAASATVSGVVGMMGSSGGLSVQGSSMKLQWLVTLISPSLSSADTARSIDQLDKADAPPIPESYIYLLGLQCLVSLCDGFQSFTAPLYTSLVVQRPRAAGDTVVRAPPAFDLASLPADQPSTKQLQIVSKIIETCWPALLAALSFVINTNLSDDLFVDVLASYQAMTNVAGMLALSTPRDAFFSSLAKFAVPTRVVSSLDPGVADVQTPRSTAGSISENLGLIGSQVQPGLSERNSACLKVLITCAMYLAGSLGDSWFGVLEALQNADYVLTASKTSAPGPLGRRTSQHGVTRSVSMQGVGLGSPPAPTAAATGPRHPMLSDLDADALQNSIQRLFDSSKNLDDGAFKYFIDALCRLSHEMIGMQVDTGVIIESDSQDDVVSSRTSLTGALSPGGDATKRRRVSGIHNPRTMVSRISFITGIATDTQHSAPLEILASIS
jgi:hypothetical protein